MLNYLSLPRHFYCSLIEISVLELTSYKYSIKEDSNDSVNKGLTSKTVNLSKST